MLPLRPRAFVSLLAACGGLVACGGGSEGARSPSSGACLPIAPMRLLALEHRREWEPVSALAADGTISQRISKRASPTFRLQGDRLLAAGAPSMTCTPDGVLHIDGMREVMRFDGQGALVTSDGMRIFVADSGAVDFAMAGRSRAMPWRVEGVTPQTRRTAEILVLATVLSIDWHFH